MPDSRTKLAAIVGGGLAVIATILAIATGITTLTNDRPLLEVAEFTIDRPGNTNANVYAQDYEGRTEVLADPAIDITLRNRGNKGTLVTSIELVVTGHSQIYGCLPVGDDVLLSAQYDFIIPEDPQLPLMLVNGARNEVPANGFTRFTVSLGPGEQIYRIWVDLYAFDLYVRTSESDDRVLVGQGKVAANSVDLQAFREFLAAGREFDADCAKRTALDIARIEAMPGASSPDIIDLVKITSLDRE